ncbi:hypothetical protein GCM10022281_01950 [Sphingomonas rosea]|uniref:Phage gp6-like head-tail connector protein n=1 Tax=Sphingomonas rosea TaxID=335605 RepID=A0ABP7TJF5_9SPHN
MLQQDVAALCVSLNEAQAYARVETGEEEAILAGLLRVSSDLCEAFLNQALMARPFTQVITAGDGWTLLGVQPVRTITALRSRDDGVAVPASDYRTDIDHDGRAFVSGLKAGSRYEVTGTAGMAAEANMVPEPVRQGILRLCAHLFANRDGPAGELPRAVTALWRPYRRAGLCR